jgi:hypothetical protein
LESTRKARVVRQIWLTSISLAIVAIVIFILSLNFAQTNGNAGASCAPSATPVAGAQGAAGLSAYDLWILEGNTGTKSEFLKALVGTRGPRGYTGSNGISGADGHAIGSAGVRGDAGASAYQLWLDAGNTGTPEEFLVSLVGQAGTSGADGSDGSNGVDGLSAYELWLSNGNTGDITGFIASLKGDPGAPGQDGQDGANGANGADGADGRSAFEIWLAAGHTGTEQDFLASLKGEPGVCTVGSAGKSAYEIWLAQGNSGSEQDFLDSLKGAAGSGGLPYNGSFFDTTTQRNIAKPNLMKFNTTDPWTVGIHVNSSNQSRIYFEHPGVYNIQFSTQFAKTDSGTDFIDIWMRKNGENVPMSDTELRSWGNDDRQVAAWNFLVDAKAGDYYELAWQSADANVSMLSTQSNGVPGIPSVILTVTQVR